MKRLERVDSVRPELEQLPFDPGDSYRHIEIYNEENHVHITEQNCNRIMPDTFKTASLVVRDGDEKTLNEWVEYFNSKGEKNHMGREYTYAMIQQYAIKKKYGFAYKEYPDLPGEVWKDVEGSKTKQGMWRVSNMNRCLLYTSPSPRD